MENDEQREFDELNSQLIDDVDDGTLVKIWQFCQICIIVGKLNDC